MPLSLTDLHRGDILLLQDATSAVTHVGIAFAQAVLTHSIKHSSSSNITHAGLYDGRGKILEASGALGLRSEALASKHPGSTYQVYRYQNDRTADMAAWWAENLILTRKLDTGSVDKGSGFGRYGLKGTGGLMRSSNKGKSAKANVHSLMSDPWEDRGFYCSNFVCECYELATKGQSPINVDYNQISPKRLQGELRKGGGWSSEGDYVV